MVNTGVSVTAKNDDHLDADKINSVEAVETVHHSPTRSPARSPTNSKNMKSPMNSHTNRLNGRKSLESKRNISLEKNVNQKKTSPAASKSQRSSSTTKIPSISKLGFKCAKTTVTAENRQTQQQQLKRNNLSQKVRQPVKKQVEFEQKQTSQTNYKAEEINPTQSMPDKIISRSNSKTGISRSESLQHKTIDSSFKNPDAILNQLNSISKCQAIRSSSMLSVVSKKGRSASNNSLHDTPCSPTKTKNKTNMRKITSIAGDFKKNDVIEKDVEVDQNEKLPHKEMDSIKSVVESVDDFKCRIKTFMDQWFSVLKNELKDSKNEKASDVDELQILKSNDLLNLIDDWCTNTREIGAKKFRQETEDGNKSLKDLEKKYNDFLEQHEKDRLQLENDLAQKAEIDRLKKDAQIKDLQKEIKTQENLINNLKTAVQNLEREKEKIDTDKKHLEEELKSCRDCIATTNKKLQESEQQLRQDKRELKAKSEMIKRYENELIAKNKLETDLAEMAKKMEKLKSQMKEKNCSECVEHMKQISELTSRVGGLESDKETLQQRSQKLEEEVNELEKVREKLTETESKVRDLQTDLDNKEKYIVNVPANLKEVQTELAKLRELEAEKQQEIDKLKTEQSKSQFNICQLEQQVQRDQQLLEVRSVLINSLQTNEKTHRIHIEELFAQVGEKNTTINDLNSELQAKSEEFRNLFTTLSAKQMETANQEHIIKLLEESNERSQMLRVKQEEKIGRLEEELAHLKHTIAMYEANILAGNTGRNIIYPAILPSSKHVNYNENFYYYVSERKRKRHVDINVKKYEA